MNNGGVISEKRIQVVMWALIVIVLLLIFNLATLMSVFPVFLKAKIAHAPTQHMDYYGVKFDRSDEVVGSRVGMVNYD